MSQRNPPDRKWRASLTWEIIQKIKSFTSLPLMLKGIATSEDALIAVEQKVDTIWVSNHGGRQLDYGRGTLDILPEVVDAVDNKANIILDGGIQRGSDVVKAIAMGVDAVAIGKMQGWGLAAGGLNGLIRVLEILEDEIRVSMGLLGIRSFKEITKNHIIESDPVNLPHEMSSWVNKSKDRII
jgi:glycolate oxidase